MISTYDHYKHTYRCFMFFGAVSWQCSLFHPNSLCLFSPAHVMCSVASCGWWLPCWKQTKTQGYIEPEWN